MLRLNPAEGSSAHNPADPRRPQGISIRDKVWQRLLVEGLGLPQPGFAAVTGNRVEGSNAPWQARVETADFRTAEAELRSAAVPGFVIVVEGIDVGLAVVVGDADVLIVTRNPHVTSRLGGSIDRAISSHEWPRFVADLCSRPLPLAITKTVFDPAADIGDALRACPGSFILKPRLGSNGVAVVRIVSHPDGTLTAASDCPSTAQYLDELPLDPREMGRDLVVAAATHRRRFLDRAIAGLPERALDHSILEEEIYQDRTDGSVFEPRVVVQRVAPAEGEFAILGAICKRIDSSVGASVARGFREEPLAFSLRRFLADRVSAGDLNRKVGDARDQILGAADCLRAAVVPLVEATGARVHQFGIDSRLCWNPDVGRAEFQFLEIQFGMGRVDWTEIGSPAFVGYETPEQLRVRFGPEFG